jgi:hypothetical protein
MQMHTQGPQPTSQLIKEVMKDVLKGMKNPVRVDGDDESFTVTFPFEKGFEGSITGHVESGNVVIEDIEVGKAFPNDWISGTVHPEVWGVHKPMPLDDPKYKKLRKVIREIRKRLMKMTEPVRR